MVRFDNELVEELCEKLLSEEENRLKLVRGKTNTWSIITDKNYLGLAEERASAAKADLEAAEKALLITRMAIALGADLVDDEE